MEKEKRKTDISIIVRDDGGKGGAIPGLGGPGGPSPPKAGGLPKKKNS